MQRDEQGGDRQKDPQKEQPSSGKQEHDSMIEAQKKAAEEREREGGYQ
ncbi:hypothetical protein GRI75_10770 [Altererythrobacter soli]|uniref:Uncharacterized protein n=1 Tax=Croceibacterium soli TaxID=1739690 RepID=A0A6I4UT94_9SPHN|nr:hypothetical protein [Croceibacterium soli]MXP42122.1 hypothetical protein [Croceibacterium soli]